MYVHGMGMYMSCVSHTNHDMDMEFHGYMHMRTPRETDPTEDGDTSHIYRSHTARSKHSARTEQRRSQEGTARAR